MSLFKDKTADEIYGIQKNYMLDSWSYSKLSSFARNEKAFEMNYIYGMYSRSSATTVAGQAYHCALDLYFKAKQEGKQLDLVDAEAAAFGYIDNVAANSWKLQSTTPTIEECNLKANKMASDLLRNFYKERSLYENEIKRVIAVELVGEEYITVNGVDIPLPCNYRIDLIVETMDGKIAVVDHKSQAKYTAEDEMKLAIGVQAITYVLCYESKTGEPVDEVWFVENKASQNKDKTDQLRLFKVPVSQDTRRLYEALLYEPLKRMLEAISNPDYIYLINDADNYTDKAELYDFWARTQIAEIEEFNVEENKKELVAQRLKKVRDASLKSINPTVIRQFREEAAQFIQYDLSNKNMTQEAKIEHVLRSFNILVKVAHKFDGYSSNTYLLEVSAGVKVASIGARRLDIANYLDVANVRISPQLSVYQGKSYVSIDFAKKRDRTLNFDPAELVGMCIPLGKDNFNNTIVWDLENQSTPHILMCGSTGSGKSVELFSIIEYCRLAKVDKIVIFDPKYEFKMYQYGHGNIEVYNEMEEIESQLQVQVDKMNQLIREGKRETTLVIFDEYADAVQNAAKGGALNIYENVFNGHDKKGNPKYEREIVGTRKPLSENLQILLQKGRSSGFRIVAATQRASVKIITGDAKVNFPVQICFKVPKEADSRVVLDEPGAESLAGAGDGLIKSPEYPDTVRFQSFYVKPHQTTANTPVIINKPKRK